MEWILGAIALWFLAVILVLAFLHVAYQPGPPPPDRGGKA